MLIQQSLNLGRT